MRGRVKRVWRRTGRVLLMLVLVAAILAAGPVHAWFAWVMAVPMPWVLLTVDLTARAAALALVEILLVAAVMLVGPLVWEIVAGDTQGPAPPLKLSGDEQKCACHAFRSYGNPARGGLRYVERFWLEGGVFGFVDDSDPDVIYVVFRGTSEAGNWFLTNAQAHTVKADKVFKTVAAPVPGRVHQGFFKAFEDLWFDCREDSQCVPIAEHTWRRWLWPVLYVVMLSPVVWWPVLWPVRRPGALADMAYETLWPVMAALLLAALGMIQIVVASGIFERWFCRRRSLRVGPALSTLVPATATDKRRVVFTGHSLGGALATLAFVQFCQQDENRQRPAELVTFGAPRPGDDAFLEALESLQKRPGTRLAFFADRGDPVPYLPPAPGFAWRIARRATWLSAVLSGIYVIGWCPYALAYQQRSTTRWVRLLTQSGDEGVSPAKHSVYHDDESCKSDIHDASRFEDPKTQS